MKKAGLLIAFLALTACAGAQEPGKDLRARCRALLDSITEKARAISDTQNMRAAGDMEKLAGALETVDKTLAGFTPESVLSAARAAALKRNLARFRKAVRLFYNAAEGNYPENPSELVPDYLEKIPALELPEHPMSSGVVVLRDIKGGRIDPYIKDTGKWLYIYSPGAPLDGKVVIDCKHKDKTGKPWFEY